MSLDLDALEASEKEITPANMARVGELYGNGAVIPLKDLQALIAELRASRKVVDAARMFPISVDQYNSGANEPLDGALAEYDELVNVVITEGKDGTA